MAFYAKLIIATLVTRVTLVSAMETVVETEYRARDHIDEGGGAVSRHRRHNAHDLHQPLTVVRWEGDDVVFNCASDRLTHLPGTAVTWSVNHAPLTLDNTPPEVSIKAHVLTVTGLPKQNATIYKCEIWDKGIRLHYKEFRLFVFDTSHQALVPSPPVVQPKSRLIHSPEDVTFQCQADARMPSVIQWVRLMDPLLLPAPREENTRVYTLDYADDLQSRHQWHIQETSMHFPSGERQNRIWVGRPLLLRASRSSSGKYACVVTTPDQVNLFVVDVIYRRHRHRGVR